MNEPREVEEMFNERTLAFSNRIMALLDDTEVDFDEEIEAILAAANL